MPSELVLKNARTLIRLESLVFGLKTASTAFCRALEVTTREKGKDRKVFSTTYDIDHIIEVNEWEVKIGGATKAQEDDFFGPVGGPSSLRERTGVKRNAGPMEEN